MLAHKTKKLHIYFGDALDGISKELHCKSTNAKLVDITPFKTVAQKINIPRLSALNQVHSTDGLQVINTDFSFNSEGDYLLTNQINVGLGVLTADCVPLIVYDAKNNAVGIAHAGWRGSVVGIAIRMLSI